MAVVPSDAEIEHEIKIQAEFTEFCQHHITLAKEYLDTHKISPDMALCIACKMNNREIIDYAIELGADDFDAALHWATEHGNMKIAKLMVKYGATDYDSGMVHACGKNYYPKIVKYMLKLGATNYNWAIDEAACYNRIELVKFFIRKGANNFKSAMHEAGYKGNRELIDLFMENGSIDYDWCLYGAMNGKHFDLCMRMLDLNADIRKKYDNPNLNSRDLSQYMNDNDLSALMSYLIEKNYRRVVKGSGIKYIQVKIRKVLLKDLGNELQQYVNY